jgi:hypothetical protein
VSCVCTASATPSKTGIAKHDEYIRRPYCARMLI